PSDQARQRQQLQRQLKRHVTGRRPLRNARTFRLLILADILLIAELDVGTEAAGLHRNIETGLRVPAKHAVAAVAVGGQRTGVAALGIIGAADERAELAGLQVEFADAAGRAL